MSFNNLLLGNTWSEFVDIFTGEFAWITIVLMVAGLILCLIEAILPGFGIFGTFGILCEVASVIVHATLCNGTAIQIIILVLLLTLVTLLIFLLVVRSARYGLLGRTPLVDNSTAVPINYAEQEDERLREFIGKEGALVTDCKPMGKAKIDGEIIEVCSKDSVIAKGQKIKVVDIEDSIIYVKNSKSFK